MLWLVASAAVTGLALAGCSAQSTSTPPAGSPSSSAGATPGQGGTSGSAAVDPASIQWVGTVCTALLPVSKAITSPPTPDLSAPEATQQAYSTYLGTGVQTADAAVQQISAAGSPPVSGGDQVAKNVRDQVQQLRTDLMQAKDQVDGADPNDLASVVPAVTAAGSVIGSLGNGVQVLGALSNDPLLRSAYEQAPSCAELPRLP